VRETEGITTIFVGKSEERRDCLGDVQVDGRRVDH
jgi:hypothetical protein